jgi:hypothetical protein
MQILYIYIDMENKIKKKYDNCIASMDANFININKWANICNWQLFAKIKKNRILKCIRTLDIQLTKLDEITDNYIELIELFDTFNIHYTKNILAFLNGNRYRYTDAIKALKVRYNIIIPDDDRILLM